MKKTDRVVPCALCIVLCALCIAPCAEAAAEKDGGLVQIAGKGCLAVVDCQSGLDWSKVEPVFQRFDHSFHVKVVRQTGGAFSIEGAAEAVKKTGANAALFVCDKPGYPLTLMASEQKWAFVNLAPLKTEKTNYENRCQALLMRGIYRALGSDTSRALTTCLAPVHKIADLDRISSLGAAMDSYMAVSESCKALGIEPVEYLTFREACELENPPAPTNDLQRTIAAEVKAAMKK